MWRGVFIFLLGGVLGSGFGFAVGIFAFPYIFPPPVANESIVVEKTGARVATGEFIHANPSDPIHYGKGGVTLYEQAIHLGEDFEVGPGPDYHVYLVPESTIRDNDSVPNTMFVDLGKLRAFKGSQVYYIPEGVELKNYPSVVIWCKQFGALISPADLKPVAP